MKKVYKGQKRIDKKYLFDLNRENIKGSNENAENRRRRIAKSISRNKNRNKGHRYVS